MLMCGIVVYQYSSGYQILTLAELEKLEYGAYDSLRNPTVSEEEFRRSGKE